MPLDTGKGWIDVGVVRGRREGGDAYVVGILPWREVLKANACIDGETRG